MSWNTSLRCTEQVRALFTGVRGIRILGSSDAGSCIEHPPSASSSDLLGNGEMLVMRTIERPADPLGELVGPQKPVELHDPPFPVYPLGLDGVQPRTLLRKRRQLTILTPQPLFLTSRLCFPSHLRTSLEMCQLALSQMSTSTSCPPPRVVRRTTKGTASLHRSRACRRRTSATSRRRSGAGRARSRRSLWDRGRPWRPTAGSYDGAFPPRRSC